MFDFNSILIIEIVPDSIQSFKNKMQNLKQNTLPQKQIIKQGVGQIMRGDEAKKQYAAEINLKYDTVDGFNKNQKKQGLLSNRNRNQNNNSNTNTTTTTSPKSKRQEITILTSAPKSLCYSFFLSLSLSHVNSLILLIIVIILENMGGIQSSSFRQFVTKEEKSRKFVTRKDEDESSPSWSNIDGEEGVAVGKYFNSFFSLFMYPQSIYQYQFIHLLIRSHIIEWCRFAKKNFSVIPDESWGQLPIHLQKVWGDYNCNNYFLYKRIYKRPVTMCSIENYQSDQVKSSFPLIAILVATTSRTVYRPAIPNLSLFQLLLKSLIRSLDCGFRYVVVVGYDRGDVFFDTIPVSYHPRFFC